MCRGKNSLTFYFSKVTKSWKRGQSPKNDICKFPKNVKLKKTKKKTKKKKRKEKIKKI